MNAGQAPLVVVEPEIAIARTLFPEIAPLRTLEEIQKPSSPPQQLPCGYNAHGGPSLPGFDNFQRPPFYPQPSNQWFGHGGMDTNSFGLSCGNGHQMPAPLPQGPLRPNQHATGVHAAHLGGQGRTTTVRRSTTRATILHSTLHRMCQGNATAQHHQTLGQGNQVMACGAGHLTSGSPTRGQRTSTLRNWMAP